MKKVIGGKVYDTEKAKEMASIDNGYARNDFHYVEETLCRKRTGEFFLHGVGGAATKYAQQCGQNNWCGGEKIIPISYEAAQKWAEENLDGDDYEKIFGIVEDSDEKTQLCLYLKESTAEKLKRKASESGMTVSQYIESLI